MDEHLEIRLTKGIIIEGTGYSISWMARASSRSRNLPDERKPSCLFAIRKMVLIPGLIGLPPTYALQVLGPRSIRSGYPANPTSRWRNVEGHNEHGACTRLASEEDLVALMAERALEHLLRGVTTCEVKSGYGLDVETELKMLRAIRRVDQSTDPYPRLIPTCLAAHVRPPEFKTDQHYLDFIINKLLPIIKKEGLAERVDIYIDRGAFSPDLADEYLFQAKNMGFVPVVHADQFAVGGAAVAARVGAISADHLERSTEREFKWLKEKDVVAVVLPGSSLGLGDPFAPAQRMLDAGLCVAIASDWNPGTAPMGDLLVQASLLSANQKMTAAETFAGITFRAARALGLADRGRVKTGQLADLIGFPCDSFEEILYRQGALSPSLIIKGGKRVLKASNPIGG
jgi:imidazolonepropionase